MLIDLALQETDRYIGITYSITHGSRINVLEGVMEGFIEEVTFKLRLKRQTHRQAKVVSGEN